MGNGGGEGEISKLIFVKQPTAAAKEREIGLLDMKEGSFFYAQPRPDRRRGKFVVVLIQSSYYSLSL